MSKRSVEHVFLIQHGFSDYLSYCRSVVIAVVCFVFVCLSEVKGSGWLRQVKTMNKLALKLDVVTYMSLCN
jgi:hypothetical protein